MSFNLMLPPILGVVGLVIAFVIYAVMSRAPDGEAKERGIAEQIHIGAMVFMHREYKLLLAFAAVLIVGILVSPLGTNTAIAFVAARSPRPRRVILVCTRPQKPTSGLRSQPTPRVRLRHSTLPSTAAQLWASAWRHWVS